jgi:hypothetical protein
MHALRTAHPSKAACAPLPDPSHTQVCTHSNEHVHSLPQSINPAPTAGTQQHAADDAGPSPGAQREARTERHRTDREAAAQTERQPRRTERQS